MRVRTISRIAGYEATTTIAMPVAITAKTQYGVKAGGNQFLFRFRAAIKIDAGVRMAEAGEGPSHPRDVRSGRGTGPAAL